MYVVKKLFVAVELARLYAKQALPLPFFGGCSAIPKLRDRLLRPGGTRVPSGKARLLSGKASHYKTANKDENNNT